MDSSSVIQICNNAAGIAGNIFAFVLFVSPIPTFQRIIKNKSTEQFSGLPYLYSLLNCLICLWYGLPVVSHGIILVATVNSIGAAFQLTYSLIFITYADKTNKVNLSSSMISKSICNNFKFRRVAYRSVIICSGQEATSTGHIHFSAIVLQVKMSGLLLALFGVFGIVVLISLRLFDHPDRQMFVGWLSIASLIFMFASPLFIINLVIRTKSVEFMPFYLSLATFLMSVSFFAYGLFNFDPFIYFPNGVGSILGIIQLALYCYYHRASTSFDRATEPLLR